MANTSTRGILLTMLSAVTFGFAFTLGPMTYGEAGSNPVTLTFLRNFLSYRCFWRFFGIRAYLYRSAPKNCGA